MSVIFSKALVKDYKTEMLQTYGVLVSENEAQIQLLALVRSMFPVITEIESESRERNTSQDASASACVSSVSDKLVDEGGNEVGASITPTS